MSPDAPVVQGLIHEYSLLADEVRYGSPLIDEHRETNDGTK
ncbi:MAG: hypothetical protein K0S58_2459 [Nitrospira sp.]|jgi:hypothetical protein|nr:hypothetical protein [Nitrospira sp.]